MYRGRFGIIAGLRKALARPAPARPAQILHTDLKNAYIGHVGALRAKLPRREAMEAAVGGSFSAVGAVEAALLRHYGLQEDDYLIDVGCGSGRLAAPLSQWLKGPYLGTDLVPELLDHACELAGRPDWRFEEVDHIRIPETSGKADMVAFFSVLTHLLHEQGYWYLEEARRVLRPGGRIVFSFLEFQEPGHWPVFEKTVADAKTARSSHLNVFMDRQWIPLWAQRLKLEVLDVRAASDVIVPEGGLGQSLCVLRKPR